MSSLHLRKDSPSALATMTGGYHLRVADKGDRDLIMHWALNSLIYNDPFCQVTVALKGYGKISRCWT